MLAHHETPTARKAPRRNSSTGRTQIWEQGLCNSGFLAAEPPGEPRRAPRTETAPCAEGQMTVLRRCGGMQHWDSLNHVLGCFQPVVQTEGCSFTQHLPGGGQQKGHLGQGLQLTAVSAGYVAHLSRRHLMPRTSLARDLKPALWHGFYQGPRHLGARLTQLFFPWRCRYPCDGPHFAGRRV